MRTLLSLLLGAALFAGFAITPASAGDTQAKTTKNPKHKGKTKGSTASKNH